MARAGLLGADEDRIVAEPGGRTAVVLLVHPAPLLEAVRRQTAGTERDPAGAVAAHRHARPARLGDGDVAEDDLGGDAVAGHEAQAPVGAHEHAGTGGGVVAERAEQHLVTRRQERREHRDHDGEAALGLPAGARGHVHVRARMDVLVAGGMVPADRRHHLGRHVRRHVRAVAEVGAQQAHDVEPVALDAGARRLELDLLARPERLAVGVGEHLRALEAGAHDAGLRVGDARAVGRIDAEHRRPAQPEDVPLGVEDVVEDDVGQALDAQRVALGEAGQHPLHVRAGHQQEVLAHERDAPHVVEQCLEVGGVAPEGPLHELLEQIGARSVDPPRELRCLCGHWFSPSMARTRAGLPTIRVSTSSSLQPALRNSGRT